MTTGSADTELPEASPRGSMLDGLFWGEAKADT